MNYISMHSSLEIYNNFLIKMRLKLVRICPKAEFICSTEFHGMYLPMYVATFTVVIGKFDE